MVWLYTVSRGNVYAFVFPAGLPPENARTASNAVTITVSVFIVCVSVYYPLQLPLLGGERFYLTHHHVPAVVLRPLKNCRSTQAGISIRLAQCPLIFHLLGQTFGRLCRTPPVFSSSSTLKKPKDCPCTWGELIYFMQ